MLILTQLALWKYDSSKWNLWRMYRTLASRKTKEYEGRKLVG